MEIGVSMQLSATAPLYRRYHLLSAILPAIGGSTHQLRLCLFVGGYGVVSGQLLSGRIRDFSKFVENSENLRRCSIILSNKRGEDDALGPF